MCQNDDASVVLAYCRFTLFLGHKNERWTADFCISTSFDFSQILEPLSSIWDFKIELSRKFEYKTIRMSRSF